VGAVCESADPHCRGNHLVHSASAIIFFVIYDIYMLTFSLATLDITGLTIATFSAITKTRWTFEPNANLLNTNNPFSPMLRSLDPVAVFEWSDVALIMAWSLLQLARIGSRCRLSVVTPSCEPSHAPAQSMSISMIRLAQWAALVATSTALAPLLLWIQELADQPISAMPSIASGWTSQPGNWIGHWGCAHCAAVLGLTLWCLQKAHACSSHLHSACIGTTSTVQTLIGLMASLALAGYGAVTEFENMVLNRHLCAAWFTLYCGFMLTGLPHLSLSRAPSAVTVMVTTALSLGCMYMRYGYYTEMEKLPVALEWVQWGCCWTHLLAIVAQTGVSHCVILRIGEVAPSAEALQEVASDYSNVQQAGYVKMVC